MGEKLTLLKPKIDVVFHALFREGNEKITKAMIQAATKEKIQKVNLDNDRHLVGKYPEEKLGIVDLKATLDNGTICDIEIQLADNKDTAERFLFYWSRIYSSQLVKGDDYGKLNKVIGIIIIDYDLEKTKEIQNLSTKWKIREVSTGKQIELTDVLELYIIEIPKARKILTDLGYNPNMFGQKRIDSLVQHIKKQALAGNGFSEGCNRTKRVKIVSNEEFTPESFAQMQH